MRAMQESTVHGGEESKTGKATWTIVNPEWGVYYNHYA